MVYVVNSETVVGREMAKRREPLTCATSIHATHLLRRDYRKSPIPLSPRDP